MPKTKDALETIVGVVSPYLGETMARSAARAHCEKLGIVVEGRTSRASSSMPSCASSPRA